MNLQQTLASLGGNVANKRVSKWATTNYVAVKGDEAFGLTPGTSFTLWVAQSDFETKSGSKVTKGEWFAVENK